MTDISDVTHGFTKLGKGIIAKKITIQQDLIATGHSNKDEPTKTFNIKLQNNSGGTADTFMTMTNTGSTKSTEITGNLNITGNLTVADAAVGGGSSIIDQSNENDTVKNAIANALDDVTYTNSAFSDNYSIVNSIGDNLIRLITIANNDNMKFIFYSSGVACLLNTYNAPVISGDLTYTVGGSDITTISGATFTADKTVTWSLSGGTNQSDFNINGSGELSFSSAKNYIQGGTNTYQVTIKALDKNSNDTNSNVTLFSEKNISVTINDTINPTISHSSPYSILENVSTVATLTADETVTWSIESGLNGSLFEISSGGVLSFLSAPDFENPEGGTNSDSNEYQVTVEALDAAGNSSTATITVNVTNVDDVDPVITGPSGSAGDLTSSVSIFEGTTSVHAFTATDDNTVTFDINGGPNASEFSITSAGVLTFNTAPTFDSITSSNNEYVVVVRATDSANNTSEQTVTVTVEPNLILLSGDYNYSGTTISGNADTPINLLDSVITFRDSGNTGNYGANERRSIIFNAGSGKVIEIKINSFQFEHISNNMYDRLGITAGDTNDDTKATDGSGNLSFNMSPSLYPLLIKTDESNPLYSSGPWGLTKNTSSIPEWYGGSTSGGGHIFTDADSYNGADFPGLGTTYYMINKQYVRFYFQSDGSSHKPGWDIQIRATTDENGPVITGPSGSAGDLTSSITIMEGNTSVYTFTASDDSVPVTFSKNGGANESEFSITSAGVLTFNTAPTFDSVTSSNNEYVVVVRATDSANNTSDQTVTVNVIVFTQTLINWDIETFNNESFSTGLWDNLIISSSSTGYSNIWSSISSPTQWTITDGTTPSGATGPNSGDGGAGYYIFTEASSNNNKTFRLQSDTFKFAVNGSSNYSKFTFKYHMFGADLDVGPGLLCVKILKVDSSGEAQEISPQCVFRREGEQHTSSSSDNWTEAVIEFNNNMQMYDGDGSSTDAVDFSVDNNNFFTWVNGSSVKLIIEAKTGNSFNSDIAIDTLKLEYVEDV